MYRLFTIWIGKLLLIATRWRGGGSAFPGLVVEKLYPNFLQSLRNSFYQTVLVAGTNGKTTTSKMLREMLSAGGMDVLHNRAGSNMPRGIISSTLEAMDWRGNLAKDIGLFEVDEGFMPQVAAALQPKLAIALNLHRDQLDRYGELDRIVKLLSQAFEYCETVVINRDDPKLAGLKDKLGPKALWFGGVESVSQAMPDDEALHMKAVQKTKPTSLEAVVEIQRVEDDSDSQIVELIVNKTTIEVKIKFKGVFNAYNAAAALTAVYGLEQNLESAKNALEQVKPVFGRSEVIKLPDNKSVQLLLVKNPSGFNHTIQSYLKNNDNGKVLIIINDNYADGRDVSWLWDVNIEALTGSKNSFTTSGIRGAEMQLRLKYADIDSEHYHDLDAALANLIGSLATGETGYIVPTYTAMLDARRRLSKYSDEIEEWR